MSDELRKDDRFIGRSCLVGFAFVTGVTALLLAAWRLDDDSAATAWVIVGGAAALTLGPAALAAWLLVRGYRCPTCGRRLPRVAEASPALHFRCDACGVTWDVGWKSEVN